MTGHRVTDKLSLGILVANGDGTRIFGLIINNKYISVS
jgi:hypothetical protein